MGEGRRVCVKMDPFATVNDALRRIYRHSRARGLPMNYGLYLRTRGSQKPLKLSKERILLFTRIGEQDTLIFMHSDNERKHLKHLLVDSNQALVSVRCPIMSLEQTFRVPKNASLKDIQEMFVSKQKLSGTPNLRLFAAEYECPEPLSEKLRLDSYNCAKQISFVLRTYVPPQGSARDFMSVAAVRENNRGRGEKCAIYGVDPDSLPQSSDPHGLSVPAGLEKMRAWIAEHNGFQEVGIFRLAGNENTMSALESRISAGGENIEELAAEVDATVHDFATIIKRTFKYLPQRIFSTLSPHHMTEYGDVQYHDNASYASDEVVDRLLPPRVQRLYTWLLFILAEVASAYERTKMDPYNLGVVIGPCLVSVEDVDPMGAFRITNQAAAMVACSMSRFVLRSLDPAELAEGDDEDEEDEEAGEDDSNDEDEDDEEAKEGDGHDVADSLSVKQRGDTGECEGERKGSGEEGAKANSVELGSE
eukprot:TRINITY_DN23246_c0_g1_i1.p1 TRINITY_DN23246_c0_g1~~TRINITY_DN23246_c0_g1_i1.p1  ORF type:complete len:531 (+),score=184.31 TRINITY_DN23246_c0_g1_i1:165-1595(+)